jgi:hypothetical protein
LKLVPTKWRYLTSPTSGYQEPLGTKSDFGKALEIMFKNWREYQEAVASIFRKQGCLAIVEAEIKGVRATHKIDVYVSFVNHGITINWVIECKLWKSRVPKEKIAAIKTIVDDVGADRGIIFSEKGFQSGAYAAARQSNITLVTSLDEFERTVKPIAQYSELQFKVVQGKDEPPIYEFPDNERPHTVMKYGNRIFTGNWSTGSISIVDPDKKIIESTIDLDNYEAFSPTTNTREIRRYPPGSMAIADSRLFLGQIFSEFMLVIDIATKSIVKRIMIPGGGEGSIASSQDGRYIYFASNKENSFFIIDSATYEYKGVPYPRGGRGSMSLLAHLKKPHLYIGIQRGGILNGKSYPGGNSFLAVYDLARKTYIKNIYLAEIIDSTSDNSTPASLLYDEDHHIYVGMFQSNKGIYKINDETLEITENIEFKPNKFNKHFSWVDPLSLALYKNSIISLNRNNRELVLIDKKSAQISRSLYLGEAPNGPQDVVAYGNEAIVSYPERNGLLFIKLESA